MLPLRFETSLIFLIFALYSCGHIEHSVDVVSEKKIFSPVTNELNKTRNQILQNKNALRIALLKLDWGLEGFRSKKNKVIVLESGLVSFIGGERLQWDQLALARLHGQLVPELYKLLQVVDEKNMELHVVCVNQLTCNLLKQNLSDSLLSKVSFTSKGRIDSLKTVRPYLIISSNESLFSKLIGNRNWQDWKRRWVKIDKVEYSGLLAPDDLARVVPTVHEF